MLAGTSIKLTQPTHAWHSSVLGSIAVSQHWSQAWFLGLILNLDDWEKINFIPGFTNIYFHCTIQQPTGVQKLHNKR